MYVNKIAKMDTDNKFYISKMAELVKANNVNEYFKKRRLQHYKRLIKKNNKIINKWLKQPKH